MGKQRIDQLLVEMELAPSREKAKKIVMAGLVFVEGVRVDKPGTIVDVESKILVKGDPVPYVSRGGLKLEKALHEFEIEVQDRTVIDVGASTGGFTDCLLQNGAALVYAVDVGYGQLDWKLRQDKRVVVMERTNIRYVNPSDLLITPSLATIDVAFISLTKFFSTLLGLLTEDSEIIALIKPQFEAGRGRVGKKGVVRDPAVHLEVVKRLTHELQLCGSRLRHLTYSPITGPEGNIEYLAHFQKNQPYNDDASMWSEDIVNQAWKVDLTGRN